MGLHYILQHLDKPGNYARILFVDFSSAFNTIMPDLLSDKLTQLSVPTSICQWIASFLTDRQQLVRLGKLTSRTLTTSTGAPQGCVLSPLLFSLYTNDCTSKDPSVKLLKFADDTTVIGLIKDGDESAYRQEVEQLAVWCSLNNLELNTLKTVEMIVDFRRNPPCSPPTHHHEQHCDCSGVIQVPGTITLTLLRKRTSEDYNGQSGLLRGLSVPLCPASKNFTPPEWGIGLRKSLWTPHTQLTLSLNCCPLAGATDHWAQKQPDTRTVFIPQGCIPPEQHITHPYNIHL